MPDRDFSTISPSARAIALVRSQTSLPYARAAAQLLFGDAAVAEAEREVHAAEGARARIRHFELRGASIDDALAALGATRIVELAAGLAFRGLALAARPGVHYVDTDLPGIIAVKRELVTRLHPAPLAGVYRLAELDATDEAALRALVAGVPAGPVAVVNEGLLMYLDAAEKLRLARAIHAILGARGGAWITADVYVRTDQTIFRDDRTRAFLAQHDVDRNKFADYGEAAAFFASAGFSVEARRPPVGDPQHARETWVLRAG